VESGWSRRWKGARAGRGGGPKVALSHAGVRVGLHPRPSPADAKLTPVSTNSLPGSAAVGRPTRSALLGSVTHNWLPGSAGAGREQVGRQGELPARERTGDRSPDGLPYNWPHKLPHNLPYGLPSKLLHNLPPADAGTVSDVRGQGVRPRRLLRYDTPLGRPDDSGPEVPPAFPRGYVLVLDFPQECIRLDAFGGQKPRARVRRRRAPGGARTGAESTSRGAHAGSLPRLARGLRTELQEMSRARAVVNARGVTDPAVLFACTRVLVHLCTRTAAPPTSS